MTTRELANLIRDHLNDRPTTFGVGYADTITTSTPGGLNKPESAEFVLTDYNGTAMRISVATVCEHPEEMESEQTFSFCTLCGEVTSE